MSREWCQCATTVCKLHKVTLKQHWLYFHTGHQLQSLGWKSCFVWPNPSPLCSTLHRLLRSLYCVSSSIAVDGFIVELVENLVWLMKTLKGAFGIDITCWGFTEAVLSILYVCLSVWGQILSPWSRHNCARCSHKNLQVSSDQNEVWYEIWMWANQGGQK